MSTQDGNDGLCIIEQTNREKSGPPRHLHHEQEVLGVEMTVQTPIVVPTRETVAFLASRLHVGAEIREVGWNRLVLEVKDLPSRVAEVELFEPAVQVLYE